MNTGKGLGIVVNQPLIKKGDIIWKFEGEGITHNIITEQVAKKKINKYTIDEKQYFLNHIFGWNGHIYELIGDCKFMNHSVNPSLITYDGGNSWVASRDLYHGDELTDNYGTFDNPEWYIELCQQYDVEWAGKVSELYS